MAESSSSSSTKSKAKPSSNSTTESSDEATLEPFVLDQSSDCQRDEAMTILYEYQQNSLYCDFKINIKGKIINCHRNVLSASCPYFEGLFKSKMKECEAGEVKIENVDYDTMKSVVQYLYSKKMPVDWKNVENIIRTCDLLQIPQLKMELGQHISAKLTAKNCMAWKDFAYKYNIPELHKNAKHVMYTKMEELCKHKAFQKFTLTQLHEYLDHKELVIKSRDHVLEAVLQWVKYDPVMRKKVIKDLFKLVRLNECTPASLRSLTTKYKDLITDPKVKEQIYEAVIPLWEEASQDRPTERKLIVVGGIEHNRGIASWNFLEDEKWKPFTDIPPEYNGLSCPIVILPDGLAILNCGEQHDVNMRYMAKTRSWNPLPPSPRTGMEKSAAVYADNAIYILGGEYEDRVYHLDLASMKWCKDPHMFWKQMWPIAEGVGDGVYVVYNSNNYETQFIGTMIHYSQKNQQWQYKCRLPQSAPGTHGACMVGMPEQDSLFLLGGQDLICAQYRLSYDTWYLLQSPYYRHNYGTACVCGDVIYLCGGYNVKEIEEYNTKQHTWQKSSLNLPAPLQFFKAAIVKFL